MTEKIIPEAAIDFLCKQVLEGDKEEFMPNHLESDARCTNESEIREFFKAVGRQHGMSTFSNFVITDEMEKKGASQLVSRLEAYSNDLKRAYLDGTNVVLAGNPGTGW